MADISAFLRRVYGDERRRGLAKLRDLINWIKNDGGLTARSQKTAEKYLAESQLIDDLFEQNITGCSRVDGELAILRCMKEEMDEELAGLRRVMAR